MLIGKKYLRLTIRNLVYGVNRNPFSRWLYVNEINKRSHLPTTDIMALSKHISMFLPYTSEISLINDWYGHAKVLKKYLGQKDIPPFKFAIEHGTYLSEQVAEMELETKLPSFVTYSDYRVKILKKHRPFVYAIGPMIHYASEYLSRKESTKEKKRLGKTLLYFPSHSLIGLTNSYNQKKVCSQIKELARNYDTVRVCVYWKDILLGMHQYYQKLGWECVTAGHILDPLFLPRVKSIIKLSDLTISNDASSPLSYCVYLKKPHIIFYQRPKMSGSSSLKNIMLDYWKSEPYNMFIEAFSEMNFNITKKQQQLINYYLGTNRAKNKKVLKNIILETEENYKNYEK